jgi:hypothetical protein
LPAAPLQVLGGGLADELLLGGQRIIPDKALASGFQFRHETIASAFAAMIDGGQASGEPASGKHSGEASAPVNASPALQPAENAARESALPTAMQRLMRHAPTSAEHPAVPGA